MKNKVKILKKFVSIGYYWFLLFTILIPFRFVMAGGASTGWGSNSGVSIGSTGGGVNIGSGVYSSGNAKITNPINVNSIQGLIESILKIIVAIGTPIAVLFLMFAGFKFITAQGDPGKIKDAKDMLTWVIVGIVVLLGASLMSVIIKGTIDQLKVGL